MKNKILVIVRGGLVQEVRALSPDNVPAVMILDMDNLDKAQLDAAAAQALQVYPVTVEEEHAETDAIEDQAPAAAPIKEQHSAGAVKVAKALTGYEYEEAKTIETPAGYKTCKGVADMIDQETGARELLAALVDLQNAVREYKLLDIKKRFSLCTADAQANAAIFKYGGNK